MTRFHLVRHGPTHARAMVGWSDLPADLSDTAALERLRAALPGGAAVVSSDLIRAVATADAIQGPRPRLPHDPGLREMHFGAWEQQSFDQAEASDPDLIRAFWESPGDVAAPGGESWNQLFARVTRSIDALAGAHRGGDVVVVAHFGVILCAVQRAAGLRAEQVFAHRIDNLSLTSVQLHPEGWRLGEVNRLV